MLLLSAILLLVASEHLKASVLAASCPSLPISPSIDAAAIFQNTAFDYIIIGAGAGGLPVAARVSDNPKITVGLIEAGILHDENDPLIAVPGFSGQSSGNPAYDWSFSTVPQTHANGQSIPAPRGKMIGGSTGLNFMAWDRASKSEYDAWGQLSDPDGHQWTWDSLLPYLQKTETVNFQNFDHFPGISSSKGKAALAEYQVADGFSGPLQPSFNINYTDIMSDYVKAWNNLRIPTNANPFGGDSTGVYNIMSTVDRKTGTRSYGANTYFQQACGRTNLKVLTGAQATKILFSKANGTARNIQASSILFNVGGTVFTANASREIILATGAVQTPQLLELSGIGNATLLRSLGITPIIDLPGVGENLQDHIFVPTQFQVKPGVRTFDELRINATFSAEQSAIYNQSHMGWLAATDPGVTFLQLQSFMDASTVTTILSQIERQLAYDKSLSPLQKAQYKIQASMIKAGQAPQTETILFSKGLVAPADNTSYFSVLSGIQHPFSRGFVHINSTDPLAPPVIDPRYLSNDLDTQTLLAVHNLTLRLGQAAPIKDDIVATTFPPADMDLTMYVRETIASGDHLMGTAPMAARSLGGVVDSNLRVYGTQNLRIADSSVIPLSIATHLQATVYAIGEKVKQPSLTMSNVELIHKKKAADLIKNGS